MAPQTPIQLYSVSQQNMLLDARVVVFEMHNAKKLFGFWAGAPNTHTTVLHRPANMLLDAWVVVFEMHNAKKIIWVPGWRPKHPYHRTP